MESFINLFEAQKQLQEASLDRNENILQDIKNFIQNWEFQSESTFDTLKNDIINLKICIQKQYFPEKENDSHLNKIIHCLVHKEIYYEITSIIREKYKSEDFNFYETCKFFSNTNISPQQFGSTFYPTIPNAAVVELSVLDNHRSPIEKTGCLCHTYDLIYAEVKNALILKISKYSDNENEIPIVNHEEVVPILMSVVAKSKPFYFVSNLFYTQFFSEDNLFDSGEEIRSTIRLFRKSMKNLLNLRQTPMKFNNGLHTILPSLNVCETIKFVESNTEKNENQTIFDEEKRRIASLIMISTSENLL